MEGIICLFSFIIGVCPNPDVWTGMDRVWLVGDEQELEQVWGGLCSNNTGSNECDYEPFVSQEHIYDVNIRTIIYICILYVYMIALTWMTTSKSWLCHIAGWTRMRGVVRPMPSDKRVRWKRSWAAWFSNPPWLFPYEMFILVAYEM